MFCNYCNAARPQNAAPCPNCGAPSSLQAEAPTGSWGNAGPAQAGWGGAGSSPTHQWEKPGPQLSFEAQQSAFNNQWDNQHNQSNQWNGQNNQWSGQNQWDNQHNQSNQWSGQNQWDNQAPQRSFEEPQASFAPMNGVGQDTQQRPQEPPGSLLPVPYQSGMGLQPNYQQELAFPVQTIQQMLPALPEDSVYVPPMYTKPRPIIPRYRIISGFISFMIISLLLCGGAAYYAQVTGKFNAMAQAFTKTVPQSLKPVPKAALADPPPLEKWEKGPAQGDIPSATTTSAINKGNYKPLNQDRVFKPNQVFYIVFTVPPKHEGTVDIKWYTNGTFYKDDPIRITVNQEQDTNEVVTRQITQPMEGKVELYWNDKLAQTLYFVVR